MLLDDDDFSDVQKAVIDGKVSTVVPIEIARRYDNIAVREELLLRTDVNQEDGTVSWHGLRLLNLDLSCIRKIHWVKHLRLARNGLRSIPEVGAYLKQVCCYFKSTVYFNDLLFFFRLKYLTFNAMNFTQYQSAFLSYQLLQISTFHQISCLHCQILMNGLQA